jgi:hypothetical protein
VKNRKILSEKQLKQKGVGDMAQVVVECLSSKCKALSSKPHTAPLQKKKRKKERTDLGMWTKAAPGMALPDSWGHVTLEQSGAFLNLSLLLCELPLIPISVAAKTPK